MKASKENPDKPEKKPIDEYDRVVKYGKDGDFTNDGYEIDCDLTEIGE